MAVLLVGLGSILLQAFLLPDTIDRLSWIAYSVIGVIIGVILSFLAIELLIKYDLVAIDNSHLVTFPLIFAGFAVSQYILLSSSFSTSIASNWLLYSFVGFGIAILVLGILSVWIDFSFSILETRESDFSAILRWALLGLVLGLGYSISTSRVFQQLY